VLALAYWHSNGFPAVTRIQFACPSFCGLGPPVLAFTAFCSVLSVACMCGRGVRRFARVAFGIRPPAGGLRPPRPARDG
jgi:hypothetical protein